MPAITPDMPMAIWSILFLTAAFGFWIDASPLGRYLSGTAAAILTTLILANVNILPNKAPAYSVVWSYFVPLAIPLLLYKANLRMIVRESGIVLGAFLLGAVGVVLGTFLGLAIIPLGTDGPVLAGLFSATYIGGSMNFAAVAQALDITDSDFLTASVAADNLAGIMFLIFLTALPALKWAQSAFPERANTANHTAPVISTQQKTPFDLFHLTLGLGLSFAIVALSKALATSLGIGSYAVLFITAITVALATLLPNIIGKLNGDFELGIGFMYVFFASIGAGADVSALLNYLPVFAFAAIIILVHAVVLFGAAKLFKFSLAELVVASCACILGPTVSAAVAGARNWHKLITPAILTGILGYVIATFLGVAITESLR